MVRHTDTRALVRELAQELLARGEKPTQAAIRSMIEARHGVRASPNVVGDELDAFWAAFGEQMVARYRAPGVPAVLAESFARLWDEALAAAGKTFAAERAALAQAAEAARLEAQAARERAAAEAERLGAEAAAAAQRAEALDAQLAAARAETAQLTEALAGARRDTELYRGEIEALRAERAAERADYLRQLADLEARRAAELERTEAARQAELAVLATQHEREAASWDGLRRHLLRETDRIREEGRAAHEAAEARAADLQVRAEALARRLDAERTAHATTRGALDAAQAEVQRLRADSEARLTELGRLRALAERGAPSPLGAEAAAAAKQAHGQGAPRADHES